MKIAHSFISKEKLMKKIARRNQARIADYTTVSTAFKPEDLKIINDNLDSIARYAERKNLKIDFEPSSENMRAPKMSVYKQGSQLVNTFDGTSSDASDMLLIPTEHLMGSAKLPAGMTDNKEFVDAVKSNAAKFLYNQK
jgi:hypothetical protein